MQHLTELWWFLSANWDLLCETLLSVVVLGEAVTKWTKTETDDGFIKRIGILVDKVFKKVPSRLKEPEVLEVGKVSK